MKKNKQYIVTGIVFLIIIFFGVTFFHYEMGYLPNVSVNGTKLGFVKYNNLNKYVYDVLDKTDFVFDNEDLDKYSVTYEFASLDSIKNSTYTTYLKSLFLGGNYHFEIVKIVDADKVIKWVEDYNKDKTDPISAYIEKKDEFLIVSEKIGTKLDVNRLVEKITPYKYDHIELNSFLLQPDILESDLQKLCKQANDYVNWTCTYSNGSKISSSIEYVTIDDKIGVIYDDSFIDKELDNIISTYNETKEGYTFESTNKEPIALINRTLSTELDISAEKEYLKNAMKNLEVLENRTPIFKRDYRNLGNTYVEVSIDNQHLWYYENGSLVLDCAIVTGTKGKNDTPIGCYYITEKINGKYLTGPGYKTWVNRWMRITDRGHGLHDANWRSSFGGSIFTYDGSHGCINMPNEKAANLYEKVSVGTIVLIY